MENITTYSLNEIIALITSVAIGTGAYLGFIVLRKQQKINLKIIFWILLINLFVTYLFSEILKIFKWGAYRTLVLPLVAYAGQYLMEWLDKRYLKIFDASAKKLGLDINNENDSDEFNNDQNENQGKTATEGGNI